MPRTTPTQTVTIGFQVPAGMDLPSETRAAMKALIIRGLHGLSLFSHEIHLDPEERALLDALLLES